MTELETIIRAKTYIDKLANGINPLDDTAIPDGDIVNNVRLSRCFFFVSDVLRQVIENTGVASTRRKNKQAFNISFDDIQKYPYSDDPIPVSKIAERINSLIDIETTKKITYKNISDWLISLDLLTVETRSDGKSLRCPPMPVVIWVSLQNRGLERREVTSLCCTTARHSSL